MSNKEKEFQSEVLVKDFPYRVAWYYRLNDSHNKYISEFNIQYDKDSRPKKLIQFLRLYKDRKINVLFTNGLDKDIAAQMAAMFPNFRVRLNPEDMKNVGYLRENEIPFFFNLPLAANTYGQLEALLDLGVCAVYIIDDLTHNAKDVHEECAAKGVQVRCVLNQIPSTAIGISYKDTIYDPRNIDELAEYYDVFEFGGLDNKVEKSRFKFDVLFRTYFENKNWHGELSELNEDIPFPYHLDFIQKELASYKNNCQRRCDVRQESKCRKCQRIIEEQQQLLRGKGIAIKYN